MAFECLFQSFSYKSFANIPDHQKGGPAPLELSPKSATDAALGGEIYGNASEGGKGIQYGGVARKEELGQRVNLVQIRGR